MPGYFGGFFNYFSRPYAFWPHYSSFGGYVLVSSSTYTSTDYILESLENDENSHLAAVVTTPCLDPNEASKAAEDYVKETLESLEGN